MFSGIKENAIRITSPLTVVRLLLLQGIQTNRKCCLLIFFLLRFIFNYIFVLCQFGSDLDPPPVAGSVSHSARERVINFYIVSSVLDCKTSFSFTVTLCTGSKLVQKYNKIAEVSSCNFCEKRKIVKPVIQKKYFKCA